MAQYEQPIRKRMLRDVFIAGGIILVIALLFFALAFFL